MRKEITFVLCCALTLTILAPVITISLAGKPDTAPPLLEKRVFIHYKRGYGKPETPRRPPPKEKGHSDHYSLLGKGVKWKTTAILVIDPDGSNLSANIVKASVSISAEEWDDGAYSGWGGVPPNLFDGYTIVYDATFDEDAPDGRNEVLFGDYEEAGVIAVTIIWGYFGGPPGWREIIEFDIMFDTDFTWGDADANPGVMDLQNIATHELGHGAGLGDIYNCELETMYGYSHCGDTVKRNLYIGDIAGIQDLYG